MTDRNLEEALDELRQLLPLDAALARSVDGIEAVRATVDILASRTPDIETTISLNRLAVSLFHLQRAAATARNKHINALTQTETNGSLAQLLGIERSNIIANARRGRRSSGR